MIPRYFQNPTVEDTVEDPFVCPVFRFVLFRDNHITSKIIRYRKVNKVTLRLLVESFLLCGPI
jgi:hypothetical protein